jgi:taurine transport system ATP-binding protein
MTNRKKTVDTNKRLLVENISMTYSDEKSNEIHVLDDISFSMENGDFFSFLGTSGCGKTTLLNILAGFLKPTDGQITIDGKKVENPGLDRGVVFQKGALFEWLSVYENAEFGLKMQKVPKKERREITMNFLELVGLQDFADSKVYNLSGGMQQRVAIVRSLATDPSVILMDEPLGALDALTREKMQILLLDIWRKTGKMIFFITHSVEEALFLSTELFVLSERPGKIVKRFSLPFSKEINRDDSKSVKYSPEFIGIREDVLNYIWESGSNIK